MLKMTNGIFINLVLILLIPTFAEAYNRKFLKIENCTTSGKTSVIEECQFKDSRFNFSLRIFNGSDVSNVRIYFKLIN